MRTNKIFIVLFEISWEKDLIAIAGIKIISKIGARKKKLDNDE